VDKLPKLLGFQELLVVDMELLQESFGMENHLLVKFLLKWEIYKPLCYLNSAGIN